LTFRNGRGIFPPGCTINLKLATETPPTQAGAGAAASTPARKGNRRKRCIDFSLRALWGSEMAGGTPLHWWGASDLGWPGAPVSFFNCLDVMGCGCGGSAKGCSQGGFQSSRGEIGGGEISRAETDFHQTDRFQGQAARQRQESACAAALLRPTAAYARAVQ